MRSPNSNPTTPKHLEFDTDMSLYTLDNYESLSWKVVVGFHNLPDGMIPILHARMQACEAGAEAHPPPPPPFPNFSSGHIRAKTNHLILGKALEKKYSGTKARDPPPPQ